MFEPNEHDFSDLFNDIAHSACKDNISSVAYKNDSVIAIVLNTIKQYSDVDYIPKIDLNTDFADEIERGEYKSHKENQIVTFLNAIEQHQFDLLGKDVKLFKVEIICVSDQARGLGIAKELMRRSFEAAHSEKCSWMAATCTAVASQTLFAKLGFSTFFEMPFEKYRENGKIVFNNPPDNGKSAKFMAIRL
ncbi:unnamed protein product [Heligmosomoides polygyrus]|uniref:N-acetyltransferase domain-containing protein n=1 Tax=Heligmosomoides polygyrus TaxID=6339 RepID=A0A183GSQ2_HELPZ|nr:unnamed protein product [Heligmosomoides polygyrus]